MTVGPLPFLCAGLLLCACTGKDVVARVGNREIHLDDLALQRRQTGKPGLSDDEALKQLIARERLAVEATRSGLDETPEVKARLRAAAREVLAQAAAARVADEVTEARALEFYRADPKRLEVRSVEVAQMVFLASPASTQELEAAQSRATAAWAQLLGGDDFAEVAKKRSEDPSGANGGVLGRIHEGEVDQPLFEAMVALPTGGYSKPVRGPAGFHIFKAVAAATTEVPPFEATKSKLVARLRVDAQLALESRLETAIPVKLYPEHLVEGAR